MGKKFRSGSLSLTPVVVLVLAAAGAARGSAPDCVDVGRTRVCLSWSRPSPPRPDRDYRVDTNEGSGQVVVVLMTGDAQWNLTATDINSGLPADIDSVRIDPAHPFAKFGVGFGNGSAPAVGSIGALDLTTGDPRGWSRITGGRIGTIRETLTLQSDLVGKGGDIIGQFVTAGVAGEANVVAISEAVCLFGEVTGIIRVQQTIRASHIVVEDAGPTSLIDFNELNQSQINIGQFDADPFEGYLLLRRGVTGGSNVFMYNQNEGVIDLGGGDVDGFLETSGGGGSIINGGTVTGSGHVWLSQLEENVFSGTASFKQIDTFGVVEAEFSNINGTVNITADMNGQLFVRVGPLLENGRFNIGGDVGRSGLILVAGSAAFGGDLSGGIQVAGTLHGRIEVEGGTLPGSFISLGGMADGSAINLNTVGGDTAGSIFVGTIAPVLGDVEFDGCIRVHGDLPGRIAVAGCHKTQDDLNICIDGTLTGAVEIVQTGCKHPVTWSCGGCD